MLFKIILGLSLLLVALEPVHAKGPRRGGGGDPSEIRFNEIADDILAWVTKGGAARLKYSPDMNLETYQSLMIPILQNDALIVGFVTTQQEAQTADPELKVTVVGQPKTCRGFGSLKDQRLHILCNVERFKEANDERQYQLVHHEFASLVGIETNIEASSDYFYSHQLTVIGELLTFQSVLKLSVNSFVPWQNKDAAGNLLTPYSMAIMKCHVTDIRLAAKSGVTPEVEDVFLSPTRQFDQTVLRLARPPESTDNSRLDAYYLQIGMRFGSQLEGVIVNANRFQANEMIATSATSLAFDMDGVSGKINCDKVNGFPYAFLDQGKLDLTRDWTTNPGWLSPPPQTVASIEATLKAGKPIDSLASGYHQSLNAYLETEPVCVLGDSKLAFEALRSSASFGHKDSLKFDGSLIQFKKDKEGKCLSKEIDHDGQLSCVKWSYKKNAITVSIPQCREWGT